MISYFKTDGRGRFLLTLLLPIVAITIFIFLLSPAAVQHPIHAIEIDDGLFLHGWNISCLKKPDPSNRHTCRTSINGQTLEIKTRLRYPDFINGPVRCEARFGTQGVTCDAAYITSSYWEKGVRLSGSRELAEAFAQEPRWRNWQSLFYGWYEFEYGQFGAILSIIYTLFVFTLSFKRFSSQPSLPLWLQTLVVGIGLTALGFFLIPRIIPQLIADFSMSNINRGGNAGRFDWATWGMPILIIGSLATTSLRFRNQKGKHGFATTLTNSLLLSFFFFFLSYMIIFLQFIILDFID